MDANAGMLISTRPLLMAGNKRVKTLTHAARTRLEDCQRMPQTKGSCRARQHSANGTPTLFNLQVVTNKLKSYRAGRNQRRRPLMLDTDLFREELNTSASPPSPIPSLSPAHRNRPGLLITFPFHPCTSIPQQKYG